MSKKLIIGFIGQGWIGKNYADNFEDRGYNTVRYSLDAEYIKNADKISKCDIVIIAVPTPSTPQGFDDSILRSVIKLVGKSKTAVIKSTLLPGRTSEIQAENPDIFVLHSPEFLREAHAREDTDNPNRNIVGIPINTNSKEYNKRAKEYLSIVPKAPFELICSSNESEMIKYVSNCLPYTKIVFLNLIYDLCEKISCDYNVVKEAMIGDPMISNFHLDPLHKTGRGAGGDCLIKDFAALRSFYEKIIKDDLGIEMLKAIEKRNIKLLRDSKKDLNLVNSVYGRE